MRESERRETLASFLRIRRARLDPVEMEIPLWGRRRTPGLRREEVAMLAGMSITWYTWLEQGRDIVVSVEVLERLSQALHLSLDERLHLFTLAGRSLGKEDAEPDLKHLNLLQVLLDNIEPCPANIRNARWDVVAWNRAEALVADWASTSGMERNALVNHFSNPWMKQVLPNWERDGKETVALFRMEYAKYADTLPFREVVNYLQEKSEEFRLWWSEHEVLRQRDSLEFLHPQVGLIVLDRLTSIVQQEPLLTLRVLLPHAGTESQKKLELLAYTIL